MVFRFGYRKINNKPPESLKNNASRTAILIVELIKCFEKGKKSF